MKLKEWSTYSGILPTAPGEDGSVSVAISQDSEFRPELMKLEDWQITSVGHTIVYLKPREDEYITWFRKHLSRDQFIYTISYGHTDKGRNRVRYLVSMPDKEIQDITAFLSNALGLTWKNGKIYVYDITGPIETLANKIFGNYEALKHWRM